MTLEEARILKSEELTDATTRICAPRRALPPAVRKDVLSAKLQAADILTEADRQAARILEEARERAASMASAAEVEARERAAAEVAARTLAFAEAERRRDERALDRVVALARLLAERLLGEELMQRPDAVTSLARTALAESQGARRATVFANPEDARQLREGLADLDAVAVEVDGTLRRGDLRVETEVGVLEAQLGQQLDRLSAVIAESLREP